MSVLDSYDSILASIATHGAFRRSIILNTLGGQTAPTATAGGPTQLKRFYNTLTVPSMGAGILGMYLIQARCGNMGSQTGPDAGLVAIEYELGSLDIATNVFTAGVSMPSKRYSGRPAVQTAAQMVCLSPSASLTATTPTITVTYTNEDGTGGRTATLVLPTNAVSGQGSYLLSTSLQAGDVAVRAVTGMSTSAGSAGTLKAYGYLLLAAAPGPGDSVMEPLSMVSPNWLCETGDMIVFMEFGSRTVSLHTAVLVGVAET